MASECPSFEKNLKGCTCTYSCGKRGKCCECVTYHRSMNQIPGCFFTPRGEKQYDRSFAAFCRDREA